MMVGVHNTHSFCILSSPSAQKSSRTPFPLPGRLVGALNSALLSAAGVSVELMMRPIAGDGVLNLEVASLVSCKNYCCNLCPWGDLGVVWLQREEAWRSQSTALPA